MPGAWTGERKKTAVARQPTPARVKQRAYAGLPLSFEPNEGQTDRQVRFLARSSGYALFLTGDEAVLSLRSRESGAALSEAKGVRSQKQEGRPWSLVPSHLQRPTDRAQGTKDKGPGTNDVLRMKLVGANQAAKVTALDELPGKSNYFIGNDPKKWRTDVRIAHQVLVVRPVQVVANLVRARPVDCNGLRRKWVLLGATLLHAMSVGVSRARDKLGQVGGVAGFQRNADHAGLLDHLA